MLASRRAVSVAAATGLCTAVALLSQATSVGRSAEFRTAATCSPYAVVPPVSNHQARAQGYVACDSGSPAYSWNLQLRNRAGSARMTSTGYFAYSTSLSTPYVTCTGAYTRSFLYINVGGAGKNDSSGEAPLC